MVEYELIPNAQRKFIVYMHTNPQNGKRYIGVTGRGLSRRAGPNGIFYKGNDHFYNAIQKIGWDNMSHEILLQNLTRQQAGLWEYFLINMYDTTDPNCGYNHREGGFVHSGYVFQNSSHRKKDSLQQYDGLLEEEIFHKSEYEHIMVSNKGRVLILEDNEWKLAHFPQAMPYFTVYVGDVDNKRRNLLVHHLVYFTLNGIKITPIPSGYCISHKDGDPHNNRIQNLVYTTTSQCAMNVRYNLGKLTLKPINQYDLSGKYLFTYASAQMAARTIKGSSTIRTKADSINKSANGKTYKSYGYQWRFVDDVPQGVDIDQVIIPQNGKQKQIGQYSKDGELIKIWKCGRDAMRHFGRVSPSSIYKCANGINHTAWGYVWKWV